MSDTNPEGSDAPLTVQDAVASLLNANPAPETDKPAQRDEPRAEAVEAEAPEDEEGAETPAETEDESGDDAEEQDDDEALYFTVKIDGKEERVTADELVNGYQRTADYTRKTQEIAEQRKALMAEATAAREARQQHINALAEITRALSQPEPAPNWVAIAQEHGAHEAFVMKEQWDQRQMQRMEAARAMEAERQKQVAAAAAEIPKLIPEWADQTVYAAERPAVIAFAQSMGYSPGEISQATDPRAFKVLRLAMKAAQAEEAAKQSAAKTAIAAKKVATAPKLTKSGVPQSSRDVASKQRQAEFARFAKAPSIDKAVQLLLRK